MAFISSQEKNPATRYIQYKIRIQSVNIFQNPYIHYPIRIFPRYNQYNSMSISCELMPWHQLWQQLIRWYQLTTVAENISIRQQQWIYNSHHWSYKDILPWYQVIRTSSVYYQPRTIGVYPFTSCWKPMTCQSPYQDRQLTHYIPWKMYVTLQAAFPTVFPSIFHRMKCHHWVI